MKPFAANQLTSECANIAVFAPIGNTKRKHPLYVPLRNTETIGVVLLDQLAAIDYNARQFWLVATVESAFLDELLEKVVLIFQKNRQRGTA